MPLFYFDFTRDETTYEDDVGTELPDVEHARVEALATLCQLAKDDPPKTNAMELKVAVRSTAGQRLLVASLALKVERQLS